MSSSLQEVMSDHIDFAIIASPSTSHKDNADLVAELGIPALIEKPLATNSQDCASLRDLFAYHKVPCAVGHVERFNPSAQQAKNLLNEGAIGEIIQVSTTRFGPNPQRILDVGVSLDLLSHDVDLVRWLTRKNYVHVSCKAWRQENSAFEDSIFVISQLEKGINVNHSVNWITPFKRREVLVVGSDGALSIDLLNETLILHRHDSEKAGRDGRYRGESTEISIVHEEPLRKQLEAFLGLLQNQSTDICTASEATLNIQTIELIQMNAQSCAHA